MVRMQAPHCTGFLRDCFSAWGAAANGVTPKTHASWQKYWGHWVQYATRAGIDPFLGPTVAPIERDIVTGAFAARVRSGSYGLGHRVKAGSVTDALSAISKTIELAGRPSQLYRSDGKYQLFIERVVEGFCRNDPPTVPQLAVPVVVAHSAFGTFASSPSPSVRRTSCLVIVAFYFLLRVGEYIKPRRVRRNGKMVPATRTCQFTVGNVGFFREGRVIPRTAPLSDLLQADLATLKIRNQKNGRMGQTITQHATKKDMCPVKALAQIVREILQDGGTDDTLLCAFKSQDEWLSVESNHVVAMVRDVATNLGLAKQAIDPDLIGAHSLRAGGAMALKLHGYDDTTIMKMGRWTSLTFLQYIHNQIAHLSKDISRKMSIELPFVNVAAI